MGAKTLSRLTLLLALSTVPSLARTLPDDPEATRLHAAALESSLDVEGVQPWHLRIAVQIFDPRGKVTEQGTIEEWWVSPGESLVKYDLPSYKATTLLRADGRYRTKGADREPWMLRLLLNQVVHPLPASREIDGSTPEIRKETVGKVPLECIMLTQPIKRAAFPPLGLFPTYCFDPGRNSLRISFEFGSQVIIRNSLGRFQGHSVSLDFDIEQVSVKVASAHITTLETKPFAPDLFAVNGDLQLDNSKIVQVAGGVLAGTKIHGDTPRYPERAKQNHVSGTVVLHALIDKDGHITSLQIISAPDPDLAIASVAAVRSWTYKPYLLDGEPVEVETKITINFSFGLG